MTKSNNAYKSPDDRDISAFEKILAPERVLKDKESLEAHSHDETEDLRFIPFLVLEPVNTEEVQAILRYCQEEKIPVTARGAGTGLSGGALPVKGGISLSMKRMNRILEIDEKNFQVTVEPGVITQVLQEAVEEKGLFYPPDPASSGSCFIGGNVAENSGGPKAVKYGVVKDYILNLEVVLAGGECFWTGSNVLKNATGYNLTQLMVGSEGTLGIVTKIVCRLIPLPKHELLMLAPFRKLNESAEAVAAIMQSGITPSGLEFMEKAALIAAARALDNDIQLPLGEDIKAHLLIELDGNHEDVLMQEAEEIFEILQQFDCGEILIADTEAQKDKLWSMRRIVGEAVKRDSIYKEEDTVVPRYKLPKLLKIVKEIGKEYNFESVCYGHAGDGNLHVNILKGDMSEDQWNNELPKAIRKLFTEVKKMGGTISGEHGIGYVQKNYMDIVFSEFELELMKKIKIAFDPDHILNPGKIFPGS